MNNQVNEINQSVLTSRFIVFYFVMLASNFLTPNLFSPIIIMLALFLFGVFIKKIKKSYVRIVLPLMGVFCLGLITSLSYRIWDIERDITFALYPISLIYIGFWIADSKIDWIVFLKNIVFLGLIFSIYHLSQFILNPNLLSYKIDDVRQIVNNPGGNLIIISLVLGLLQYRIGITDLFPKFIPRYLGLSLLLLSFILSFSRTGLLMSILLIISLLGLVNRINWKMIITLVLIVISFFIIIQITPTDEVGTFRSKISNTFRELAISDYQDMGDINLNYRGFVTFQSSSLKQQILGNGFGSLLDLGVTLNLAGIDYQAIPVLHNGYAYILLKTGLLGILCYFIFYLKVLKYAFTCKDSINEERLLLSRLLFGITFCLIIYMIAVGGMSQLYCSEYVLLLGFIIRKIEKNQILNIDIDNDKYSHP